MQDNVKLEQEFSAMVAKLAKEGNDILKEMTPEQAHLIHMAIGVAGEAGELLDAMLSRNMLSIKSL
jgi:hypothetical protein